MAYKRTKFLEDIEIGKIYKSNGFGNFMVLCKYKHYRKPEQKRCRYDNYLIKFILTGTLKVVPRNSILTGRIRDPYYPAVCNIACSGNVKKNKYYLCYNRWHCMISRCYNQKDPRYDQYGGRGVKVEC